MVTVSFNAGRAPKEHCAYLGISHSKVHRLVWLYNEKGACFCEALRWADEQRSALFTAFSAGREAFVNWTEAALGGEVLVAKQLRQAVEQKVGHSVSELVTLYSFNCTIEELKFQVFTLQTNHRTATSLTKGGRTCVPSNSS